MSINRRTRFDLAFQPATVSEAGGPGQVPAPAAGTAPTDVLQADGTFATPGAGVALQTVLETGSQAIDNVTPTVMATAPAIAAAGAPVVVVFSIELENTAGASRTPNFRVFRDATEINGADRYNYRLVASDDGLSTTVHWTDTSPGAAPVYDVRALADNTGVNGLVRRLTVFT